MYKEEQDKIYCFKNSNILKNKLNIKDKNELEKAEKLIYTFKCYDLKKMNKFFSNFDLNELKKAHKFLFEEIYEWAGELRKVEISKGFQFARSEFIESEANRLFKNLKKENYLENLSKSELVEKLAYYKTELNVLHPFREGNGRTIRIFIKNLAKHNNYELDFDKISKQEYMDAMIESPLNQKKLELCIDKCLKPQYHNLQQIKDSYSELGTKLEKNFNNDDFKKFKELEDILIKSKESDLKEKNEILKKSEKNLILNLELEK